MKNRYSNELAFRLEQVGDVGSARIRKAELLAWYEQERTSKTIWSDIADRWAEMTGEWGVESTLLAGEAEGHWLLVWGGNIVPDSGENWWLQDVRKLARK
jgi:hypothetical protein